MKKKTPDAPKECKRSRVHPLPVGTVLYPKGVNSSSAQDTSVEAAHKKHRNNKPTGDLSARRPAGKEKVDGQVGEEDAVAKLSVGVSAEKPLDSFLSVDEEEGGCRAELLLAAGEVLNLVERQVAQRFTGEAPGHQGQNPLQLPQQTRRQHYNGPRQALSTKWNDEWSRSC